MEKRQYDRYGDVKSGAIPNYKGVDTGTWKEAQFQALKDKGAESAATYGAKVKEEAAKGVKTLSFYWRVVSRRWPAPFPSVDVVRIWLI